MFEQLVKFEKYQVDNHKNLRINLIYIKIKYNFIGLK